MMKLGDIVLIENFNGIKNYLCILDASESFVDNRFIETKKILLAIREDINQYCMIDYPSNYIISLLGTFQTYSKKNNIKIQSLKEYSRLHNLDFSWLQIMQLNELNKVNPDIKTNIKLLETRYNELIPNFEQLSFLDF